MLAADTSAVELRSGQAPPKASLVSWAQIVKPVEPFLRAVSERLVRQVDAFEPEIADFARDALSSQGKQLRPALVAISAHATGGLNDDLITVAAIIEMVHLATLVHDDVMDAAQVRRRRPTLAAQCGNNTSVLVGDCLFAHAVTLAAGFPTPEVCRAVALATKTVCSGEILQSQRDRQVHQTREEYFRVLRMKTAELFALSCDMGSWLSGARPEDRAALKAYGMGLGTAYQIYDDCLDLFGNEQQTGKSVGTDLAGGKVTLPILVALERATPEERALIQGWLARWEPGLTRDLLPLLDRYGVLDECKSVIFRFCSNAEQGLSVLESAEGRSSLGAVLRYLENQADSLRVSGTI